MSDHRTKDWCQKHNWCFRHKEPRTRFWCSECIDEYEARIALDKESLSTQTGIIKDMSDRIAKLEESERELLLVLSGQDDRFDRSPELQALLKKCKIVTDPCTLMVRVTALEAALDDAILAIEHAAHPVASQWLPKLRRVRAS